MPSEPTSTDFELIEKSLHGDQQAFSDLVDRHQKTLLNFLRSLNVKQGELDDLSQEVWIKIYDFRSRYRDRAKFSTFLYQVAKMKVIDAYRKKTRWTRVLELFQAKKQLQDEQRERREHHPLESEPDTVSLLDQLNQDAREVLVLRFDESLSYQEISELLTLPLGTVKSRIHSAMKKLKELK